MEIKIGVAVDDESLRRDICEIIKDEALSVLTAEQRDIVVEKSLERIAKLGCKHSKLVYAES